MTGIDRSDDRPAYRQLAAVLRERIVTGDLPPGGELPPEKELIAEWGVSRNTVREALALLRQDGLIVSARGHATRVRPLRLIGERRYSQGKMNYGSDASAFAREHGVDFSQFELTRQYAIVPAPPRVARALGIREGDDVYERQFTHAIGGVMLRLSHSYLERARFENTVLTDPDEEFWPGGTIAQLKSVGYDVTRVRTEVTARAATPTEIAILKLDAGAPILDAWRVQMTGRHESVMTPIEVAQHIHPSNGQMLVFDIPVGPAPMGWAQPLDGPD